MKPGYRLLQFLPDPFVETSITFGALVESGEACRFEPANPKERLLPSSLPPSSVTLFRALLSDLAHATGPRLPISLGPHVRMGERTDLPLGVEDAFAWVSAHVLPSESPAAKRERRHQRTRRATIGKLFLKQHHMSKYVRSYFKPELVGVAPRLVKPVSHYVPGVVETLLLEPVYLDSDRFDEELQDVASTLFAWQTVAQDKKRTNLQFTVYALGTSTEHLRMLREGFGDSSVRVIDTDFTQERESLFDTIRSISSVAEIH